MTLKNSIYLSTPVDLSFILLSSSCSSCVESLVACVKNIQIHYFFFECHYNSVGDIMNIRFGEKT